MTYGYGDSPGGWRPPSDSEPPGRGRRRAPEPADERGRPDYDDRVFEAPPSPPVFDPPGYGTPPRGPAGGRASVPGAQPGAGRAQAPPGGRAGVPNGPMGGRASVPAGPPMGGRASVPGGPPGGRASVPGGPPMGGRDDRRYGPGEPPGAVPPPPTFRPSWQRGAPEAEPSWPTPSGGPAPTSGGGWSGGPAGPVYPDDPHRYPPSRRDQAGMDRGRSAPGSAGRVVASQYAGQGRPGPDAGKLPNRLWMSVLGVVLVVALLAVGVVGTLFMLHDNGSGSANAGPPKHDISNQVVDPTPLSVAEVFPAATVAPDPAGTPYQVEGKPELSPSCATAAVGTMATLLANQGCTQVVRATLLSPDQAYVITAGIFNMRDKAGAGAADNAIKAGIGPQKGRFTGYAVGGATAVIGTVATQLGWDSEGHFLVYCVVARADGKAIGGGDQATAKIINDMVEVTLKGTVIAARITPRPSPSASGKAGGAQPGGGPSGK